MPVRKDNKPQHADAGGKTAGKMQSNRSSSGGGAQDKSSAFDSVRPQGQIDDGKYEAVLAECVLQDPDSKGQSARFKWVIANEGDFRGSDVVQFYKLFEANGDVGKGAAFLKKDLAVLGHEDVKFADLEELFDELTESRLGAVIQVKNNGNFVNAYLQGLAEGSDLIEEFKDSHKF